MSEAPFPVTHSILSSRALGERAEQLYDIGEVTTCRLMKRQMHDTYLLQTGDRRHVLRAYRTGVRTVPDIEYELDLVEQLAARGVSAATALPDRGGARVQAVEAPEGRRHWVLFTFAPGAALQPSAADFGSFGAAVARMHLATRDLQLPSRRAPLDLVALVDHPLRVLAERCRASREVFFLLGLAERLRAALSRLAADGLTEVICHGDCHDQNAHIGDGSITFFDFDFCGRGWRSYDLAVLSDRIARTGFDPGLWAAFLAAYSERAPQSGADLEAIPWLVIARNLWVMRTVLQNAEDWGLGLAFLPRHMPMPLRS